jgi:Mg-chelatase subunit ChlD
MAETIARPEAGLIVRDETHAHVPLTGVSIEAEITGLSARVAVAQRYVNRETKPIEAVYVFPLDEGAAVCGFEAVVDGTLVVGEVHERDKAFEIYDDAMADGHGAFLLDEERPDVFQASIGNLPPGKEVLVRLTYVTELSIDGGRARFSIPTTVSPRYAPAQDHVAVGRSDAQTLNPPLAWSVPYGLDLSLRITMPARITSIESPSHPISVTMTDDEAIVKLAQLQASLDRDFVVSIDAAGMDSPQAVIERADDGTEAIAVSLVPRFTQAQLPAEIIFVVDRSGSMDGSSIDEVRNALQLCLRSMISGCRFNIVGFGSTHESLFPETRLYDERSLDEASRHVREMRANLGGTEILAPLTFALEQLYHAELPRQVVVLTDGQVTNTDAVLALASQHAATARIFTFGIGAGASQHLVRALARAGGGSAEFIYPGERIESKVVRQFGRLLSPALHDVKIEWVGAPVTSMPMKVPAVFAGGRLVVYGFPKTNERPAAVRLSAKGPTTPVSFEVPLAGARIARGKSVATLAARARIRELEEGGEWLASRGSRQQERKSSNVSKEIIELSVRYGLISRETSFVAVERRDTPVTGDNQLRRVPIALTDGWGGVRAEGRRRADLVAGRALAAPKAAGSTVDTGVFSLDEFGARPFSRHERAVESPRAGWARRLFSRRQQTDVPPTGLHALVALQRADGYWELTPDLAAILGRPLTEIETSLDRATGDRMDIRRAWATALALTWLHLHAADLEDQWRLLGRKAQRWLDDVPAGAPGGASWMDAARRFLS